MRRSCLLWLAFVAGCSLPTSSSGDVADLRGTWAYTGTQSVPALQLAGTLSITSQDGDLCGGTLTFTESDGLGGMRMDGGPVSGRVIERTDVDFDMLRSTGARRHVARLRADTIEGTWVQLSSGLSGQFRAVRTP